MAPVARLDAHGLSDGVIERGIQIYVSPGTVLVEYHVGLTENTLREELNRLAIQESSRDIASPNGGDPYAAYLHWLEKWLPDQLQLRVNDKPLRAVLLTARRRNDHHGQLELLLGAPLPMQMEAQHLYRMELHDSAFHNAGYLRTGIKGRDGVRIVKANAPPLLIRSPRKDLAMMPEGEVAQLRTVSATFELAPSPLDSHHVPIAGLMLLCVGALVVAYLAGKSFT